MTEKMKKFRMSTDCVFKARNFNDAMRKVEQHFKFLDNMKATKGFLFIEWTLLSDEDKAKIHDTNI